jgi:hypothetical protein
LADEFRQSFRHIRFPDGTFDIFQDPRWIVRSLMGSVKEFTSSSSAWLQVRNIIYAMQERCLVISGWLVHQFWSFAYVLGEICVSSCHQYGIRAI